MMEKMKDDCYETDDKNKMNCSSCANFIVEYAPNGKDVIYANCRYEHICDFKPFVKDENKSEEGS